MEALLYGHNPEERVVAVHQLNDQTIRLFKRTGGRIVHKDVEFFPFFFLADESLLKDFPKKFWLKKLEGNNYFCFIAAFTRWSEMWEAIHFIIRQYNKIRSPRVTTYQELKEILVRADPVRQFLLQSGITLFKGMEFSELVRLYIDVQVIQPETKSRSDKGFKEHVGVITLSTSTNEEHVLKIKKSDERFLIQNCIDHINKIDPDIIEGYDLLGTILPALIRACERTQLEFSIGRDGSNMKVPSGFGATGFGESEWFSFDVSGRHLVDTMVISETEINAKKGEQPISLDSIARHFGISSRNDRQNTPGQNKIGKKGLAENIADKSLYNTSITREISSRLLPPLFYLAKICPFNLKMLIHTGTPARVESLMLREYLRQKHSVPKPSEGSRNMNIPSEIFYTGVFSDIFYIELDGLYPSIITGNDIKPKSDTLSIFTVLLKEISALVKSPNQDDIHGKTQEEGFSTWIITVKQLLNSFHMYLGYSKGLFNDPEQAEKIFTISLNILKEIKHKIEMFNSTIIQSDDRGFFLLMPDNVIDEDGRQAFLQRLSDSLPEGVHLMQSNHFSKMLSYRKNNYAVLDFNNDVFIRGNGIISRGMERYLRIFIRRSIECLMTNDLIRLHHVYATAYAQITEHKWIPVDFCRTELARMDTETYKKEIETGSIAPSPSMEAVVRSGLFVKPNRRISYYYKIPGTVNDIHLATGLSEEWSAGLPDENSAYYLSKLHEAANKFREFFEPTAFERIISMDEIFGFSDEGIEILTHRISPETAESRHDSEEYGIWLDETE